MDGDCKTVDDGGSGGPQKPALSPQECYLEGDQTSLYHAAKGLMTLQALYGTIPQIFGKGECARVRTLCLLALSKIGVKGRT